MSVFALAMAKVLEWEGGFVNDPHDAGGATKYGISIRFAGSIGLDVDGDGKTTNHDIQALTQAQAIDLYRVHFWEKAKCQNLPAGVAFFHFDTAVNMGPDTAAHLLQEALGVKADGVIGPVTIASVARADQKSLLLKYASIRSAQYMKYRGFNRYGKGWFRRVHDVLVAAIEQV